MSEPAIGRWLAIAAGLVVTATVIAAIATMGLPASQRDIRLDERRVSDLEHIVEALEIQAERQGSLPPDLATLAGQPGQRLSTADPVDGAAYTYEVTGDRSYRLCAVFTTDTSREPLHGEPMIDGHWLHGTGRHCFDRRLRQPAKVD